MTEKFDFLSPEWEKAALEIGKNHQSQQNESIGVTINVTISSTPYGDKTISIVNSDNKVAVNDYHQENADVSVKTDYETAYKLFLENDMNLILSAMLEGKFLVQGDITKLLNNAPDNAEQMTVLDDLAAQLKEITVII